MKDISGTHLIIDGYVQDSRTLAPEVICDLFDKLVESLGMQYLQRPQAVKCPIDADKLNTDEDDGGWSVICQITTSHICLHSWPLRKAFMMDIFSCKDFDTKLAEVMVRQILQTDTCVIQSLPRSGPF